MLRLEIEGSWEPQDFIEVLQSIESFYYKIALREIRGYRYRRPYLDELPLIDGFVPFESSLDLVNQNLVRRARYEARAFERLKVLRIDFASPGNIDLLGIGKVVEVVANSIGRMATYYDDRHLRRERDAQASLETERIRIELEKERESLQSLKIENAFRALEMVERFPEERESLLPLLVRDQDFLSNRIADGKLIRARALTEENESGPAAD
jgi:hypothetical protein